MYLPIKENTLENKVFESLGEVSMCWSETPKGVFDSTRAKEIGDRLMKEIYKNGNTFVVDTKLIPQNIDIEEFVKTFKNQPIQFIYPKPSLQEAIEVLCNALRENKSPGSYYDSWKSNIAMHFYYVFNKEGALCDRESHKNKVLELCNIAAENFLNLLISK